MPVVSNHKHHSRSRLLTFLCSTAFTGAMLLPAIQPTPVGAQALYGATGGQGIGGGSGGNAGEAGAAGSGPDGGVGGAAGTQTSPNGENGGTGGLFGNGGAGGGGGGGYTNVIEGDISTPINGGRGGNGGSGDGESGAGGAGGDGVLNTETSPAISVTSEVHGGDGGDNYFFFGSGGGGGAGAGIVMQNSGAITIENSASVRGGNGGNSDYGYGGGGGSGVILNTGGNLANHGDVRGGAGGSYAGGGTAIVMGDFGSIVNDGRIVGGAGGWAAPAGAAIDLRNGGTITNSGQITGGEGSGATSGGSNGLAGGAGSGGASGFIPTATSAGTGGAGIIGANVSITNSGTISAGGTSGMLVAPANAVTFTGGANRLELQAGSTITGNVDAVAGTDDVLALGGDDDATFNASTIGEASQYRGFESFEKTGAGIWTLTGATGAVTPWSLIEGTLSISSDEQLGDPSAPITFDGGTLRNTAAFTTERDVTLNAGGGTFQTDADLTASGTFIGTGSLSKTGTGTLTLTGDSLGFTGAATVSEGTLDIGGKLGSSSGTIDYSGSNPDATATVRVAGPNAVWTSSTSLSVGVEHSGVLEIEDGGRVISDFGVVAGNIPGSGTVTVSGANSSLTLNSTASIGHYGNGTLSIEDGGRLDGSVVVIGGGASYATGTVNVTGVGSVMAADTAIAVGLYGNGTLTLADGGHVAATGLDIQVTAQNDAAGTINIGAASGEAAQAAGTLDAASVVFGPGAGTLVFNHTGAPNGADLIFNPSLTGLGAVRHESGTTILNANSTGFGGISEISGGKLLVNGILGGTVDVETGGTLGGSGTVGTTSVADGGRIAPGNSAGTLTIGGDLALSSGSILDFELGSPGASAGVFGISDRIEVAGNLALNGMLNLAQSDHATDGTAGLGYYRLITYGGSLSGVGLTIGATPALVDPAAYEIQSGGGNVDLFVQAAGDDTLQHWQGGDGTWNAANEKWLNQGSDVLVSWAGNHAVFKNEPGGFNGGTIKVEGVQSFQGLQFVDNGYRLEGSGTLLTDAVGSEIRVLADSAEIATAIAGTGGITKTQGGTLVLTGDSSNFTGNTTVSAGTLIVGLPGGRGSLGGTLNVLAGGTLGGSGTVGTTTIASGATISPGNSIGTLKIDGDITLEAGSTFEAEIDPALDSDLIYASGKATIDGGTVHAIKAGGVYTPGSRWTIIGAEDGVDGAFDALTQNMPFVNLALAYDANKVHIDASRNQVAFCDVARTRNQCATGDGVESTGIGNQVYDALAAVPGEASARQALDALAGEVHASAKAALIEDSRFVREAAGARLRAAFDSVGADPQPVVANGPDGMELAPGTTGRLAIWGQAFGSWGSFDNDGNAAGLNHDTGGLLMGVDGFVTDTWRLGAFAGYSHSEFDAKDRASSGSSENYHLGLYAGTQWGNLGFRSGLAYSWNDIDTSRAVVFPGFSEGLAANYDAGTFQTFGELGYRIDAAAASFEPFANLAYVNLHTDAFTEAGGAAALHSQSRFTDVTFTTLGIRAAAAFELGGIKATARGMVGWRHAFGGTTMLSTHAFAGSDSFTVAGAPIAENAAAIEAGLDLNLTETARLGIAYQGQIANDARQHGFKADLRVRF